MRGLFVRDSNASLTDPVTGYTWWFDATARVLKCWDGSAWTHSCLTQYLVPVSDGERFIAVPAGPGTSGQVLTSNGASAYPSFQAAAVATWLGELTGLGLANAADADHDITIAVGACASFHATVTSRILLNLTSALTKQIDATWAVGTNAGGLFAGTVAANTTYHVFLIRRSDTGVVDGGFDTSVTAANIPANYDGYRRIGSVVTDASSNILAFTQFHDEFLLSTPVLDFNNNGGFTTATTITLTVPIGIQVEALLRAANIGGGIAHATLYSALDAPDVAPSLTAAPLGSVGGQTARVMGELRVRTNTSGQIRGRQSAYVNTADIDALATYGWLDRRGRG